MLVFFLASLLSCYIRVTFKDLRLEIFNKENEIEKKNEEIDIIEKKFDEKIFQLEEKNNEGIENVLR
jgi:hypothetical protein